MPRSFRPRALLSSAVVIVLSGATYLAAKEYLSGKIWPEPKVVTPGDNGSPPSDAVVLFDGKDLDQWTGGDWILKDGTMTAHGGDTHSKQSFGPNYQLHVEWAEPSKVTGSSQGRGNSGVFLAEKYEVQVLDSYENPTYFDGQCGAIYKEWPPLVNACRKPGEWQSYDIIFESPLFDEQKKLTKPGYVTVLQNNVIIQNHVELLGSTHWDAPPAYEPHPPKQPIHLQFHGNPVQFRNIWIRELKPMVPTNAPAATSGEPTTES